MTEPQWLNPATSWVPTQQFYQIPPRREGSTKHTITWHFGQLQRSFFFIVEAILFFFLETRKGDNKAGLALSPVGVMVARQRTGSLRNNILLAYLHSHQGAVVNKQPIMPTNVNDRSSVLITWKFPEIPSRCRRWRVDFLLEMMRKWKWCDGSVSFIVFQHSLSLEGLTKTVFLHSTRFTPSMTSPRTTWSWRRHISYRAVYFLSLE